MLPWLKRLLELLRYAFKVATGYLSLLPLLFMAWFVMPRFGVPLWIALPLGVVANPAAFFLWWAYRRLVTLIERGWSFLWKYKTYRRLVWSTFLSGMLALAWWNVVSSGDLAWISIVCEAIAVAALAAANALSGEPPSMENRLRLLVPPRFNRALGWLRVAGWLAAIVVVDLWLYATIHALVADNWVAIPWSWLERIRIPLSLLPPLVFTVAALLARPPYVRRASPRWIFVWKKIPDAQRTRYARLLGVLPFRVFGRECKVVKTTLPGGRTYEGGERFVFWRMVWTGAAFTTFAAVMGLAMAAEWFLPTVPDDLSSVVQYHPPTATIVRDRNGEEMCRFTLENRIVVELKDIPPLVQDAFIAAEDRNFWSHDGIDPIGIVRALMANHESGEVRQGASTITQQVIKQVVLKDPTQSLKRKATEAVLAVRFETSMAERYGRRGAKEKILEIYLNHVYLGAGNYGVEAAAMGYFGKHAKDLTRAEAAMLAGLPKAPAKDSPNAHYKRAKARQSYVLDRLFELGMLSEPERSAAWNEPIVTIQRQQSSFTAKAPYACEEVRKFMDRQIGRDAVYAQGYEIQTTFDLTLQRKAQASVRYGLLDLERRLGFAGPEGHDKEAGATCDGPAESVKDEVIEANARVIARDRGTISLCVRGNVFPLDADDAGRVAKWEQAKAGRKLEIGNLLTVRIETRADGKKAERVALTARRTGGKGHPEALQAGLMAIDPNDGEVRAIVGGYDWSESQFNTATQTRRQTGSSIKPYVYLTALMNGKTVVSTVLDAPICLPSASGTKCYKNYDGPHVTQVYYGVVDLVTALAKSLNSVSLRLAVEVGLDKIIGTMRALGVRSPIVRVYPLAVGTPELTLLEHTAGYASILSNGRMLPAHRQGDARGVFVKNVSTWQRGHDGRFYFKTIYEAPKRPEEQAVPSADAYAMTHLMRGVVEFGTGTRAKKLRRPVAGKTGTTNSFRDVWFMGGTADLTVGVWVGRMTPQPIAKEATGGSIALPVWEAFMESAFPVPKAGEDFETPPRDFPIPNDIILIQNGQTDSGRPALVPYQRGRVPEKFLQ